MSTRVDELQNLLAPAIDALGLELLGLEWSPSTESAMLRLYIDAPERAVTVDDCEAVSREVEGLLDVNDPIPGQYRLEVSSPGIDRPLFSPAQFARHQGEQVKVQLRLPLEGRRRFQGRIDRVDIDEQRIVLEVEEGELILAHDSIEKARIIPDLQALGIAAKPKPGGRRRKSN